MAAESVSEQSHVDMDANNNEPVKLQNPPACLRSAVWKHLGFRIITVNGRQVTEREKTAEFVTVGSFFVQS
jgi:hypothetical protein